MLLEVEEQHAGLHMLQAEGLDFSEQLLGNTAQTFFAAGVVVALVITARQSIQLLGPCGQQLLLLQCALTALIAPSSTSPTLPALPPAAGRLAFHWRLALRIEERQLRVGSNRREVRTNTLQFRFDQL